MVVRMRTLAIFLSVSLALVAVACHDDGDEESADTIGIGKARPVIEQVHPPIDINTPPSDATKTASGLRYKKLVERPGGAQPTPADVALIHYTGWRQRTGTTFFTTKGREHPIALDLAHSAPGFHEALQLLRKGESMMLWVPPGQGSPEPLVYQIEVADIVVPVAKATQAPKG
jgi:hypothetical protein